MLSLRSEAADAAFRGIDFPSDRSVVVALSGGGDSLALLLLAQSYLDRHGLSVPLVAATVDHGLRAGSAAEAAAVGRICAGLGLAHRTLRWEGEKPRSGLMAAAREARYRLLLQAAREAGATMILVGHTLDDQAETILMREARGGGRGLAGIAPATLLDGDIWVVRPLISFRRKALRELLAEAGHCWIEDPSNENPDFERVRARAALARADGETLFERLVEAGEAAAKARMKLGAAAARLIRAFATLPSPGLVRIDRAVTAAEPEAAAHALAILLAATGGHEQLPEGRRVQALLAELQGGRRYATLARTVVEVRRDGMFLRRELRGRWTGAAPAVAGALWNGRFRLLARDRLSGATVEAVGRERAALAAPDTPSVPAALARAALAAEPRLSLAESGRDGASVDSPAEGREPFVIRAPAPWARRLPSFDLEPARAVAALFKCAPIPPPPSRGHNAA